ncbi:MAG: endonuclease/exonuclease/phosphatase family protein [Chloroflexi bacterium]|nr:endonuclease/exonuclease/phosphatase family protein [Chloroflexota bacterium]
MRRAALLVALLLWAVCAAAASAADPSPVPDRTLRIVAYNIWGLDREPPDRLIEALAARGPAVVGLIEVTQARAEAIAADAGLAALFPYQVLRPSAANGGLAMLSSWPIEVAPDDRSLPVIHAAVDLDGVPLTVIVAHAPTPLGAADRDTVLERLRTMLLEEQAMGRSAILAGDLNVTDLEPAFRSLVDGFVDVPAAVSWLPPRTWGADPDGLVLLRIDHIITTPDVVPLSSAVDCDASGSDHCLVEATVAIPALGR